MNDPGEDLIRRRTTPMRFLVLTAEEREKKRTALHRLRRAMYPAMETRRAGSDALAECRKAVEELLLAADPAVLPPWLTAPVTKLRAAHEARAAVEAFATECAATERRLVQGDASLTDVDAVLQRFPS